MVFHPNLVPSLRINGTREPICRTCIDVANPIREEKGLAPITILPAAYEPAEESSVNWEGDILIVRRDLQF